MLESASILALKLAVGRSKKVLYSRGMRREKTFPLKSLRMAIEEVMKFLNLRCTMSWSTLAVQGKVQKTLMMWR